MERQLIPVKDGDSVEARLKFTRHGPVISEDTQKNVAFAVRAAWLEPGTAPYLGSVDYMRANDWDGFLAAMNRWGAPGENQVYADAGQHRMEAGRPRSKEAQLGRTLAGSRRRPLRVGRVPRRRRTAGRVQPPRGWARAPTR